MPKRADKSASTLVYPSAAGDIPFTLTHRYHQKHINIRITHGGEVRVSAPTGAPLSRVFRAVGSKEAWIRRHTKKMGALLEVFDPEKTVHFRGIAYTVTVKRDPTRIGTVRLDSETGKLCVHARDPGAVSVIELVGKWLRRQAKTVLRGRAGSISQSIGIPVNKVFLRDQRSRWGSSSSMGNISLNWRAIMLPDTVSDYLIIHELAHQRFLDHSSDFWNLVGDLCPRYREHEGYLKSHSTLLALFR